MENKIIFIIITSILVVTLIFNSVLIAKRVSKTYMYWAEFNFITFFDPEKVKNKGVFEDLYDFEKDIYLSSLIILIFSLVIAILLLLAEFIPPLKNAFKGIVYKILNIVNIVFCGVYTIIHFVLFWIWCAIIDSDKSLRKHYLNEIFEPGYKVKEVKNRSILHLFFNLILFIILAIAAFLSFMALKNDTSSSGSSNNTPKENKNKNSDNSKKQTTENTAINNNKQDKGERPKNLLTKDTPK